MNAQLRILAINWRCLRHPQAGGAEINLFEQARRWVEQGHQVTVLCADPGRAHAPERVELIDGIEVRRMGGRFTVYLWAALFLLRFGFQFDRILDVANGIPFWSPLFSRVPGVLLVHHVHGRQWASEFGPLAAALGAFLEGTVMPLVYRRRAVIAVSPTTRDALLELGFADEQVSVVYNGITRPPRGGSAAIPQSQRIAYVGRLKSYKRLDRLVREVGRLRGAVPDIHLDIVGDGDARPELESQIAQLGLREHVTLHGFVDEPTKHRLMREATVFATPSMHEGWGLSVLEANVNGCPAVAYDVPGLRVAIRDGETGLLAADDAAFGAALARILADAELRGRLSAGARAWAATFSWETCASDTLRIVTTCNRTHASYQPT